MKYLKVYTDFAEAMEALSDAERGRLFMSMLQYASTGEAGTLSGAERFVWPIAKQNIDRAQAELEKRAENGRKGGRPKKATESEEKQKKAKESKKKQTKDNKDKDKDKDNDKENNIIPLSPNGDIPPKGERTPAKRFVKPTAEEVRAYCAEQEAKPYKHIVDYLNVKAGTQYKASCKDTRAKIDARLAENFTVEDFEKVIDKKCEEWRGTEWEKFLRPLTLFGPKFESYLNAKIISSNKAAPKPNRARDFGNSRAYSAAELDSLGTDLLGGG